MKKLLFALPLLFISTSALAEAPATTPAPNAFDASESAPAYAAADEGTPSTLIGSGRFLQHSGWYVAPSFGATTVDGHLSQLNGLRGGWLINRTFALGLTGNVFGWDGVDIDTPRGQRRFDGAYGGVLLQYIIGSDRLIHGTIDATFGGGALCYDAANGSRDCHDAVAYYVFEPTANVEINVASFMRVAVGGGYRFAATDNRRNDLGYQPDMGGFVTRTSIEFGRF